ncbi:hypothetical protein [Bradyrhizobium sp.]|uniref:hypothetical protein n=1 Tax=Bradyrhizobium sp. TaxID=376 RepID=UPI0029BFB879|nr:hypothetical protein [Bradyrhizobium sp.]
MPCTPGEATDVLSRLRLSDRLGQTFVVENKLGACSNTGTQIVVHSNAHEFGSMLMAEIIAGAKWSSCRA